MFNKTLKIDNSRTNNILHETDNRIKISPPKNTHIKAVSTNSEQFKAFTNGDPYLLDDLVRKPEKYYSGRNKLGTTIAKRTINYYSKKVRIVELQIDNRNNAYVTYEVLEELRLTKEENEERILPYWEDSIESYIEKLNQGEEYK